MIGHASKIKMMKEHGRHLRLDDEAASAPHFAFNTIHAIKRKMKLCERELVRTWIPELVDLPQINVGRVFEDETLDVFLVDEIDIAVLLLSSHRFSADKRPFKTHVGIHLPVLNMPECQVNPRLGDIRFFGNLMFEVALGVTCHDQQASVRQSFLKNDHAAFSLETK